MASNLINVYCDEPPGNHQSTNLWLCSFLPSKTNPTCESVSDWTRPQVPAGPSLGSSLGSWRVSLSSRHGRCWSHGFLTAVQQPLALHRYWASCEENEASIKLCIYTEAEHSVNELLHSSLLLHFITSANEFLKAGRYTVDTTTI